ETGGAGASPRKAFQLRKPRPKGRRSTAGLSGSQATGRRSTAGWAEATAERQGEAPPGLGGSHGRKAGEVPPVWAEAMVKGRRSTAGLQ
ncbi:hypothetical protein, partial [Neisseria meningitidis]|uniref:hypothetical protein n=1 Tax=Neisseria meningitidis TaxID=487 RepID=UPI001EDE6930